jgi:hypothetical protein
MVGILRRTFLDQALLHGAEAVYRGGSLLADIGLMNHLHFVRSRARNKACARWRKR